jgi:hypothetical protein
MRRIIAMALAGPVAAQTLPLTRDTGAPVGDNQYSKVAGPDMTDPFRDPFSIGMTPTGHSEGPVLLEDLNLIEKPSPEFRSRRLC